MKMFIPIVLILMTSAAHAQISLEQMNIDRNHISVSGLSSGGGMATQLHVIHSRVFRGAATFAGVPYGCASNHLVTTCMGSPGLIDVDQLVRDTDARAGQGLIDPPSSMSGDRVFVFNGALDTVVDPGVGDTIRRYYQSFTGSIATNFNLQAEHGQPTVDQGVPCAQLGGNYINRCNYDGAYEAMNHIHGGLQRPTGFVPLNGQLTTFRQTDFFSISLPAQSAMDTVGYIYVPSGCIDRSTPCGLHVALHGCAQGRGFVGDTYVTQSGYNEVGELNNIIILYPQAIATVAPVNPNGCWDWWGYTLYHNTKDGPQIIAMKRMIDRLVDGA